MPRADRSGASRRRISAQVSSGRSFSRSACSRAIFCTDAAVAYQYRAPSEYRYVAWSDSSDSAFAKFPMVSPGVAMPSQMCCRSIPRCAALRVGAEPRKIARASRLVTFRVPSAGRDASILAGVDDVPSMSASITGLKLSSRYCEISVSTSSASSGTPPGMISGAGSSRSYSS